MRKPHTILNYLTFGTCGSFQKTLTFYLTQRLTFSQNFLKIQSDVLDYANFSKIEKNVSFSKLLQFSEFSQNLDRFPHG